RLILSRPDVAFRFVSQGKTVYRSVGDGTLESAIFCVYGKDALASMRHVHGAQAGVVVDGYVGVGDLSRGNRQQQSFFVNGRYFRDEALSKALENGCQGWVMIGRFPCCVLSLTVPYRQVDVNVHPNKLEVRFQNHDDVARAIESLAREALAEVSVKDRLMGEPEADAPAQPGAVEVLTIGPPTTDEEPKRPEVPADLPPEPFELPEPVVVAAAPSAPVLRETASPVMARTLPPPDDSVPWPMPMKKAAPPPPVFAPSKPEAEPEQQSVLPQAQPEEKPLTYIGALFSTYLLFESGDRLLLVDQHAAHERVLYDRFMARYEGDHLSQALLTPQIVQLTARDCAALSEMRESLEQAGFEVEPFDETHVTVRAVPVILGENAPVRELLLEALDEWQSQRAQLTRERLRRHVMQMACKHAIKGGDRLSPDDVKRLLKEMLASGVQPTCPHGRPIVNELTKRELEKRFKRVQ
ncbi:MAG: DNA mismatch repair endonuclease MutL, partial [Eubacteriales bacterium]|nr:DNA mismatch repair endonuclease MutL [Eubacteriales bacterium]